MDPRLLLLIVRSLSPITYCSLLVAQCLLSVAQCLLPRSEATKSLRGSDLVFSMDVCSLRRDLRLNLREAQEKHVEFIYRFPQGAFALTGVPHDFTNRMQ